MLKGVKMTESKYDTKILCTTDYLQLKQTTAPAGHSWTYAHRPNAQNVAVIAPIIHLDNDYLIFLETRRPPIYAEGKAEACIELPAGLVGDENNGETVIEAVKKEVLEETGYKADKVKIVAPLISSSGGCTSETCAIALVDIYDDRVVSEPVTDGGIIINRYKIKLKDTYSWLNEQQQLGKAISAQTLAALYYVCESTRK